MKAAWHKGLGPAGEVPVHGELPDPEGLMALMAQDKKVRQGRLTFIQARGIGEAYQEREVDLAVVRGVLEEGLGGR